jgi:predicted glycoside hydrolase/deacetylase ChbG (UPF0249 family)
MSPRYLIVNADDFGQSPGVNRGVIQAYEKGILTSASLMVRWPAATEAADYARRNPNLGVGLHLDFGEWAYRAGEWLPLYRVVDESDPCAVGAEIRRQLDQFEQLVGRLPTHVDSHQHGHRNPPASTLLGEILDGRGIAVRDLSIPYCGQFYGQDDNGAPHPEWISVENLVRIASEIGPGATELGCHPAAAADLDTMYAIERLTELATLCDTRVRHAIAEMAIQLKSFAGWRSYAGGRA